MLHVCPYSYDCFSQYILDITVFSALKGLLLHYWKHHRAPLHFCFYAYLLSPHGCRGSFIIFFQFCIDCSDTVNLDFYTLLCTSVIVFIWSIPKTVSIDPNSEGLGMYLGSFSCQGSEVPAEQERLELPLEPCVFWCSLMQCGQQAEGRWLLKRSSCQSGELVPFWRNSFSVVEAWKTEF